MTNLLRIGPDPEFLTDSPAGEWVDDILLGFQRRTLYLGVDEQGPVRATLTRLDPQLSPITELLAATPVLYLHGWADYFYNTELAWAVERAGFRFYALDLRKYGRSMRPGQVPGFVESLNIYDDEISQALRIVAHDHPQRRPMLGGHSTGGLIATLWAEAHSERLSAVVLNSPWLELQGSQWLRATASPLIETMGRFSPTSTLNLPKLNYYWRSLSAQADGEWNLHGRWRPEFSFEVPRGWLSAILDGHARVAKGLDIKAPILSMSSNRSVFSAQYHLDRVKRADIVIDVETTASRAAHLGPQVQITQIPQAMHDIFASPRPVRDLAMYRLVKWMQCNDQNRRF